MAQQVNEISKEYYQSVLDKTRQASKNPQNNKDKFGNPLDSKNRSYSDRLRQGCQNFNYLDQKEEDNDPTTKKAKEIWFGNNLENEIEWGGNEWEGDEIYGPCTGWVDFEDEIEVEDGENIDYDVEKWEFMVNGFYLPHTTPKIDGMVEYKAPDGTSGSFYPYEVRMGHHVHPTADKFLRKEVNEIKNLMERMNKISQKGSIPL